MTSDELCNKILKSDFSASIESDLLMYHPNNFSRISNKLVKGVIEFSRGLIRVGIRRGAKNAYQDTLFFRLAY